MALLKNIQQRQNKNRIFSIYIVNKLRPLFEQRELYKHTYD